MNKWHVIVPMIFEQSRFVEAETAEEARAKVLKQLGGEFTTVHRGLSSPDHATVSAESTSWYTELED